MLYCQFIDCDDQHAVWSFNVYTISVCLITAYLLASHIHFMISTISGPGSAKICNSWSHLKKIKSVAILARILDIKVFSTEIMLQCRYGQHDRNAVHELTVVACQKLTVKLDCCQTRRKVTDW